MKRSIRVVLWVGVPCGAIAAIVLCLVVLVDPDAQPHCHKQLDLAFSNWRDTHKLEKTAFPNVDGISAKSLAAIQPFSGGFAWERDYMYVPGLRTDDPGDLVLVYLKKPTRWKSHVQLRPSLFHMKGWIIVPVDMEFYGNRDNEVLGAGEFSEWITFVEFRQRLQKTLDFLRDRGRPHWESAVKEHGAVLAELEAEFGALRAN